MLSERGLGSAECHSTFSAAEFNSPVTTAPRKTCARPCEIVKDRTETQHWMKGWNSSGESSDPACPIRVSSKVCCCDRWAELIFAQCHDGVPFVTPFCDRQEGLWLSHNSLLKVIIMPVGNISSLAVRM